MMKLTVALCLAASTSAFAPSIHGVRAPTHLNFEYGEFDDKLFDNDAKKVVYGKWDPATARTSNNFNPFETFKGNSPDASGVYPGGPQGRLRARLRRLQELNWSIDFFSHDRLVLSD